MSPNTIKTPFLQGWPIVGWSFVLISLLLVSILAKTGFNETGVHLIIRATARTSLALFLVTYSASSLQKLWRSELSRWMLKNRRYLGVSFAVSHLFHGIGVVTLFQLHKGIPADLAMSSLIGGSVGYILIIAMTLTSFNRTAAWIGPRWWRYVHTAGIHFLFIIFLVSYGGRAVQSVFYLPLALLLVAACSLRFLAALGRRKQPIKATS